MGHMCRFFRPYNITMYVGAADGDTDKVPSEHEGLTS